MNDSALAGIGAGLAEAQRQQLAAWNQTRIAVPRISLARLIEEQATASPQAAAILWPRALGYFELLQQSAAVAAALQAQGVKPGDVVGIRVRDPVLGVIGCLASLQVGAAFTPIDDGLPEDRVRFILEDSAARALLSERALSDSAPRTLAPVLDLDAPLAAVAPQHVDVDPDSIAYVIYTSGSTGRPKGVAVRHRNIVNFVVARTVIYGREPRFMPVHSLAFDPSVGAIAFALATGGSLALPDREARREPDVLRAVVRTHRISHLSTVPAAHQAFLDGAVGTDLASLRACMVGGERLPGALVQMHYALLPETPLFNEYGPTETTVASTVYAVPRDRVAEPLPIGRPIANTACYVLDDAQRMLPPGEQGELYIGGAGVAAGYLNRADLTAEKFLPDPFSEAPVARMYRTGDRARWLPDGQLEFHGRVDFQVKVRGYRVELAEIEQCMLAQQGVRAAVVVARASALGNLLAAYYTTADGAARPGLGEALAQTLAPYMVPTFLMHLQDMPLNPAGKIERSALPEPASELAASARSGTPPSTKTEQRVAAIWRELLSLDAVYREDDFFALGGHSLLATMVVSRVRDTLGLRIKVGTLFGAPVLQAFAAAIERDGKPAMQAIGASLDPALGPVPIAPLQETFFYLAQIDPTSSAYVVRARVRIDGPLAPERLDRALARVVQENEVLRTRFVIHQGEPVQVVVPSLERVLEYHDLRGEPNPAERAEGYARQLSRTSLDLAVGPLLRCQLLRIAERESLFELAIAHIVFDGWSVHLFLNELLTAYAEDSPAQPRVAQYRQYALDARNRLAGVRLQELRDYFRATLQDLPAPLSLPCDFPPPLGQRERGGSSVRANLPRELVRRLRERCAELGVTHYVFCLAVFELVVARWTGEHDIVLGSPMAVRDESQLESMIGCFINSVVLRTQVPELARPFSELLERVKQTAIGGVAHAEYPFDWLVADLRAERSTAGNNPLFRLFFNDIDHRRKMPRLAELEVRQEPDHNPISKFDLTFYIHEWWEHDEIDLVYDPALFGAARIEELAAQFQALLEQVCADPRRPLGAYSLVTDRARLALPDARLALEAPGDSTLIQDAFYALAQSVPERCALIDAQGSHSYRELAGAANALAAALLAAGARPEQRVAIFAPRSSALAIAMIGVLEAGCAFTVLDPEQPASYHRSLLSALGQPIWLASPSCEVPPELEHALADHVALRLTIDAAARAPARCDARRSPEAAAYVGFTSGTTAQPKGVLGAHGPVVHFIAWYAQNFGLEPGDRVSMLSGLGHDPLLRDVFAPLSTGATLCIPDAQTRRDPELLAQWLAAQRVSIVHLTPGLGTLIASGSSTSGALPALRLLLFGGERLRNEDVARAREYAPNARIVNGYGTTETPQVVGYHELTPDLVCAAPALGRGIAHTQLLVLNAQGAPCGVGELGTIHVRSPYLSRGYLEGGGVDSSRIAGGVYATGDLGRYDADGQVHFAGRPDRQVKVRGFRVELAAVEAALEALPMVARAQVLPRVTADGTTTLDAYIVPSAPGGDDGRALRRALDGMLIEAMIPSSFAFVERFPLTQNGKVDTKRLLAEVHVEAVGRPEYRAPRSQTEEVIARLWAELFELPEVGINDDFFELGGHSLLAVRMVTLLSERLGAAVPLRLLMQHSTVGRLAAALHDTRAIEAEELVVELRKGGNRPPFWIIHPIGGHVVFARKFVSLLDPQQNVYGIQARGLDGRSPPFESIPEMARHYLELIRKRQPSGPYYIGGPSLGGKVSYEIAQQLIAVGEEPALVVLFDSFAPGFPATKPALGWLRDKLGQAVELGFKDAARLLGRKLAGRPTVPAADAADPALAAHSQELAATVRRVAAASERASRAYDVQPYPGMVTLFRAGQQPQWPGMDFSDIKNGWGRFAARVDVEVVDATHQDMFDEPCVHELARRFESCLKRTYHRVSLRLSRLSTMGGRPFT